MNFLQLDRYIRDLAQSGFGTTKLQVQFYRKFSVPLFRADHGADRDARSASWSATAAPWPASA